jgi:hypothetical protein
LVLEGSSHRVFVFRIFIRLTRLCLWLHLIWLSSIKGGTLFGILLLLELLLLLLDHGSLIRPLLVLHCHQLCLHDLLLLGRHLCHHLLIINELLLLLGGKVGLLLLQIVLLLSCELLKSLWI